MERNISDVKRLTGLSVDQDIPVYISGKPGIGKSQAMAQLATERRAQHLAALQASGATIGDMVTGCPRLVDVRLSTFESVDLRGLPAIVDGKTQWLTPAIWPAHNVDGVETVLFFDELDRAGSPAVLNAALQIVLDRRIGDYQLPANVRIVSAGNGASDRGTHRLSDALANRFLHLHAVYDPHATRAYFDRIGLSPFISAYLTMRPDNGYTEPQKGDFRFATPRQWERVNRFMPLPSSDRRALVGGLVGDDIAGELESMIAVFGKYPSPQAIMADPINSPIPDDASGLYAVGMALARLATRATVAACMAYLARFPREYHVACVRALFCRDESLKETAAYVQFASANQGLVI